MELINAFPAILLSGIILLLVVLLEKLLVWPDKSHPLTMMRLLGQSLANRVLKKPQRSDYQQKVSGALSVFVILFPVLLTALTFLWFAEYQWFFDALFLFIALQFVPVIQKTKQIDTLLHAQKKALARNHLSRIVLRQVDNLSLMGITKANMETLVLRFHYQYLTTLFWFLILGGIGALFYRMCYELSQQWNIKQEKFKHFGRPVSILCYYMQWIPVRLSLILFTGTLGLTGSWQAIKNQQGGVSAHTLILATFAGAVGKQLGGPAFYNNRKFRLAKVGPENDPELADFGRLRTLLIQYQIVLLAFVALCYFGVFVTFSAR
ncbi:MAG: cobalamin biosynthesis protein [Aestuariibacter sp.]